MVIINEESPNEWLYQLLYGSIELSDHSDNGIRTGVLVQVAAQLNVRKAVGIELLETPADYAQVGSSFNLKPHSNLGKDRL